MTRVEWEDDTDTVRKLSFVVRDARTKRFELWRVASEASFVGDGMGKDGSPVGCREWHKQVSGSISLEFMQKSQFCLRDKRRDLPRKHGEGVLLVNHNSWLWVVR